jgi:hypothetical protein
MRSSLKQTAADQRGHAVGVAIDTKVILKAGRKADLVLQECAGRGGKQAKTNGQARYAGLACCQDFSFAVPPRDMVQLCRTLVGLATFHRHRPPAPRSGCTGDFARPAAASGEAALDSGREAAYHHEIYRRMARGAAG